MTGNTIKLTAILNNKTNDEFKNHNLITSKSSGTNTLPSKNSLASLVYKNLRLVKFLSSVCHNNKFLTPNFCANKAPSLTVL